MAGRESRAERWLRRWLWFSSLMYGAGAVGFLFAPRLAEEALSLAAGELPPEKEEEPSKPLWHSLASAYMATIAAASGLAAADEKARHQLTRTLLTAKAASTGAFLSWWAKKRSASQLLAAALDSALLVTTWGLLRLARRGSRP